MKATALFFVLFGLGSCTIDNSGLSQFDNGSSTGESVSANDAGANSKPDAGAVPSSDARHLLPEIGSKDTQGEVEVKRVSLSGNGVGTTVQGNKQPL